MDISQNLEPFQKSNVGGAVQWTKLFNVTKLLSIFISLLPGSGNINNSHVKLRNLSFIFLNVSNFLWVLTTVEGVGEGEGRWKIINLESCLWLSGGFCAIVNFFYRWKCTKSAEDVYCIPRKFWVNKGNVKLDRNINLYFDSYTFIQLYTNHTYSFHSSNIFK